MQLLVHGLAHLFEPGGVVGLQFLQLGFERVAHFGQAPFVGLDQLGELLRERIDLVILYAGDGGHLLLQRLAELDHAPRQLGALRLGGFLCLLAPGGKAFAQFALEPVQPFLPYSWTAAHMR